MKKIFVLFALFVLGLGFNLKAQTDESVVMEVAGEKISKAEFLKMYNKNNLTSGKINKEDLDAYLELFINYKLKLLQARELGLDTIPSYLEEVEKILESKSLLTDSNGAIVVNVAKEDDKKEEKAE